MLGLLVVLAAGLIIGFCVGLGTGTWAAGKGHG